MRVQSCVTFLLLFELLVPGASGLEIVNSLGTATPATHFAAAGTGGVSLLPTQAVGPQFTLTDYTLITEIGGFVARSSGTYPTYQVMIKRLLNGAPDVSSQLAFFELPVDQDHDVVSYSSAATNFVLGPGTYFALFFPHSDQGYLLSQAQSPFQYLAGDVTLGCLGSTCGTSPIFPDHAAVRILGENIQPRDTVLVEATGSHDPRYGEPGAWTVPPIFTRNPVNSLGSGPCGFGNRDFDQTWGPFMVPPSKTILFQHFEPAGNPGVLDIRIVDGSDPSGEGLVVYSASAPVYCAWSPATEVTLPEGIGNQYYLRAIAETGALHVGKFRVAPKVVAQPCSGLTAGWWQGTSSTYDIKFRVSSDAQTVDDGYVEISNPSCAPGHILRFQILPPGPIQQAPCGFTYSWSCSQLDPMGGQLAVSFLTGNSGVADFPLAYGSSCSPCLALTDVPVHALSTAVEVTSWGKVKTLYR